MNFVAVAVLHDFDGHRIGQVLRVALVPALGIFLAGNPNLRLIGRMHRDVAAPVSNGDARVGGNVFGFNVHRETELVANPNTPIFTGEMLLSVIDADHNSKE